MVEDVEAFGSKLKAGAAFLDEDGLHEARVEGDGARGEGDVAREAQGAGGDGVSGGAVEVGGEERVERASATEGKDGGDGEVIEGVALPVGTRGPTIDGEFVDAAEGEVVTLMLAGEGEVLAGVGGVQGLLV